MFFNAWASKPIIVVDINFIKTWSNVRGRTFLYSHVYIYSALLLHIACLDFRVGFALTRIIPTYRTHKGPQGNADTKTKPG